MRIPDAPVFSRAFPPHHLSTAHQLLTFVERMLRRAEGGKRPRNASGRCPPSPNPKRCVFVLAGGGTRRTNWTAARRTRGSCRGIPHTFLHCLKPNIIQNKELALHNEPNRGNIPEILSCQEEQPCGGDFTRLCDPFTIAEIVLKVSWAPRLQSCPVRCTTCCLGERLPQSSRLRRSTHFVSASGQHRPV